MKVSWTQAICDPCFEVKRPGQPPFRLKIKDQERCGYCGATIANGLYIRDNPANVRYPRLEPA